MSNFRTIATVTATLVLEVLNSAASAAVPGATATIARPDSTNGGASAPRVNLYLYQVTPNAAGRNLDLPTRDSRGELVKRPHVALDLHYLLSFYGDEAQLEPQRLLGSVALAMHTRSMLTRDMIRNTIANAAFPFLAASNLADEIELVKLSPLPLSLEELSKMWSVFFQTQYALSMAYYATVVFIEGEETPRTAMPVLEREIFVVPFQHPTIERIRLEAGQLEPIMSDSTIVIEGKQLRGEVTQLRIGGSDLMPLQGVTDMQIVFPLNSIQPAGSLRAGVQAVQIVQPMLMGRPRVEHVGVESNVAAMVVCPTITNITIPDATHLTIDIDLTIGKTQRVLLLLNENTNNNSASYTFLAAPRNADTNTLTIPISNVKPAEYFVRVQIDGAESLLDLNPASANVGPKVTIP